MRLFLRLNRMFISIHLFHTKRLGFVRNKIMRNLRAYYKLSDRAKKTEEIENEKLAAFNVYNLLENCLKRKFL